MDTNPLDGYKKIIVTILSLIAGSLGLFITDPAKAQTIGQFLIDVLGPVCITLVGVIYTVVQGNIDKEKAKTVATEAKAKAAIARSESPKAESASVQQPAVAQSTPAAAPKVEEPVALYTYADVNNIYAELKKKYGDDELAIAYAFYREAQMFNLASVQPKSRLKQATEFIQMAQLLFFAAFKWYTKLECPPLAEFANTPKLMARIKNDYEKANNLVCSNKAYDEIKQLIGFINDFIQLNNGLELIGAQVDLDWKDLPVGYNPYSVGIYAGSLVKFD